MRWEWEIGEESGVKRMDVRAGETSQLSLKGEAGCAVGEAALLLDAGDLGDRPRGHTNP